MGRALYQHLGTIGLAAVLCFVAPAQESSEVTFKVYPPGAQVYIQDEHQGNKTFIGDANTPIAFPDKYFSSGKAAILIEHPDKHHKPHPETITTAIRDSHSWPVAAGSVTELEPDSAGQRIYDFFRYPTALSYSFAAIVFLLFLAGLVCLAVFKKRAARLKYEKRIKDLGGDHKKPRHGPYIQLKKLGSGGFGEVCKAIHVQELFTSDPQFVAIKTLRSELIQEQSSTPAEETEFVKRFKREARLLEDLNHQNIVRLHNYDFASDPYYIVMDFVAGESLDKRLARHPQGLPPTEALKLMATIMAAIAHCHNHNPEIVHRDLKPANIMLRDDGIPIVVDFGIGIANREGEEVITQPNGSQCTPSYMAPEVLMGEKGASIDQYALGAIFYEVLTGEKANHEDGSSIEFHNLHKMVQNAKSGNVKMLKETKPQWKEFADAIDKMRALDPADRYPSVQAALQTISRLEAPKN